MNRFSSMKTTPEWGSRSQATFSHRKSFCAWRQRPTQNLPHELGLAGIIALPVIAILHRQIPFQFAVDLRAIRVRQQIIPECNMPRIFQTVGRANVQMVSSLSRRLPECLAANDPKIPSVRISERRQSPDSFGKPVA